LRSVNISKLWFLVNILLSSCSRTKGLFRPLGS
jgi:hypothetical protein